MAFFRFFVLNSAGHANKIQNRRIAQIVGDGRYTRTMAASICIRF
jgi:hypothetical protein